MVAIPGSARADERLKLAAFGLCIAFFTCMAVSFLVHLELGYRSIDTTIYALLGEGIFRHGIMPYDYAFDHKPAGIYLIYGPLALLDKSVNVFAFFALALLVLKAVLIHRAFLDRSVPFILVFALVLGATVHGTRFSGNSELVFILLQFASLAAILSPRAPAPVPGAILAGVIAVAAIQVNYVAAIPLLPALITACIAVSSGMREALLRLATGAATVVVGTALFYAGLWLTGMDLPAYFMLQWIFLDGYADQVYTVSRRFMILGAVFTTPILLALLPPLRPAPEQRPLVATMSVLLIFGILVIVLAAKYYFYYLYLLSAPAVVIVLSLNLRGLIGSAVVLAGLGSASLLCFKDLVDEVGLRSGPADLVAVYAPLAEAVGETPLMVMRGDVVPVYYSGVRLFQPLTMHNHSALMYGPTETHAPGTGEDGYFLGHMLREPAFVMTNPGWCEERVPEWQSCAILAAQYGEIQSLEPQFLIPGYTLYRRTAPGAG